MSVLLLQPNTPHSVCPLLQPNTPHSLSLSYYSQTHLTQSVLLLQPNTPHSVCPLITAKHTSHSLSSYYSQTHLTQSVLLLQPNTPHLVCPIYTQTDIYITLCPVSAMSLCYCITLQLDFLSFCHNFPSQSMDAVSLLLNKYLQSSCIML